MHKSLISIVVAFAVVMLAVVGFDAIAQKPSTAPSVVVTVDLSKVLESLDEMKAELDRTQADGEAFQKEVKGRQEEIEDLEADRDDFKVGSEQFDQAEDALKRAAMNLSAFVSLTELTETRRMQRAMLRVYNRVKTSLSALADQSGWTLVLMDDAIVPIPEDSRDVFGDISSRRVLYANPTADVTDQLIEYMNTQWTLNNRP